MKRSAIHLACLCLAGAILIQPSGVYASSDTLSNLYNHSQKKSSAGDSPSSKQAGEEPRTEEILKPVGAASLLAANLTEEEYKKAASEAVGSLWGYTNLGVANVDNNLNIREIPDESGKLVGKLPRNSACEILDEDGVWAHIRSGKVEGYVKLEYLYTGYRARKKAEEIISSVATVTTDALKVREEPSTDSEVIMTVTNGEELEVVSVEDGWIRVMVDDEEEYVSADYVKVEEKLSTAITMTELLYGQGVSDVRVDLCQYAKQFVGNPYVWGGTSLTKGADCSGFVLSVFAKYGVSLPHSSRAQANYGRRIDVAEMKPGDLIFYAKGGTINHVAIYIGGGQVIHASSPKTGIKISNYNYRNPARIVRILQD